MQAPTLTYSRRGSFVNINVSFTQSYLVGVDKEQDEENEFGQEDDQQNDEKLKKKKKSVRLKGFNRSRNMQDTLMSMQNIIKLRNTLNFSFQM